MTKRNIFDELVEGIAAMGVKDVEKMCANWNGTNYEFSQILNAVIKFMGVYQSDLAEAFQVSRSTISRWAHGAAFPHPDLQLMIISAVENIAHDLQKQTRIIKCKKK